MRNALQKKRIHQLRKRLGQAADSKCDGIWIIQPENRRYLSGFKAEDAQLNESSGSLLIDGNHCLLVTDSRYTLDAEREAKGFEIHTLKGGLEDGLPEVWGRLGASTWGFEADYVTWGLHRQLCETLHAHAPAIRLVPVTGLVEEMREVKDTHEIRASETSARMISSVLDEVIPWLKPGLTEKEVARRIEDLAMEKGADRLAFPSIVASGPNSALPHAVPTGRKLRKGEPIILDVGVRLNGYCSDMTRTVFLGNPRAAFKDIYKTVREAQRRALEKIGVGVASDVPDAAAREFIRHAGFGDYFGHGLGHGVGLATHEGPRLAPRKPVTLKKGMIVTVEPGIYVPGKGGVRLEEMVVLEREGPRILTKNDHFYDF